MSQTPGSQKNKKRFLAPFKAPSLRLLSPASSQTSDGLYMQLPSSFNTTQYSLPASQSAAQHADNDETLQEKTTECVEENLMDMSDMLSGLTQEHLASRPPRALDNRKQMNEIPILKQKTAKPKKNRKQKVDNGPVNIEQSVTTPKRSRGNVSKIISKHSPAPRILGTISLARQGRSKTHYYDAAKHMMQSPKSPGTNKRRKLSQVPDSAPKFPGIEVSREKQMISTRKRKPSASSSSTGIKTKSTCYKHSRSEPIDVPMYTSDNGDLSEAESEKASVYNFELSPTTRTRQLETHRREMAKNNMKKKVLLTIARTVEEIHELRRRLDELRMKRISHQQTNKTTRQKYIPGKMRPGEIRVSASTASSNVHLKQQYTVQAGGSVNDEYVGFIDGKSLNQKRLPLSMNMTGLSEP